MRDRHPGIKRVVKPVEVVNRLTRDQLLDNRLTEIEASLKEHDEKILEIRKVMLEIKKELTCISNTE